jgi:hypothetical protein
VAGVQVILEAAYRAMAMQNRFPRRLQINDASSEEEERDMPDE